jgi:hypothetical protein
MRQAFAFFMLFSNAATTRLFILQSLCPVAVGLKKKSLCKIISLPLADRRLRV